MDRYARLNALARRQHGCWTFAQAVEAGFAPTTIEDFARRGVWVRRHRGVFSSGATPSTWSTRLAAAYVALGDDHAVVARRSAARLWRLPGFEGTGAVELVVPRRHTPRLVGCVVKRTVHLPPCDVVEHSGFRTASVTRTVHDLAAVVSVPVLLPAAAEGYRLRRTDPWQLLDAVRARPGLAGNRRMREVIARLDPRLARTRSIAEIVAQVRLRDLGFDDFDVNVRLELSCGRRVEVDLLFEGRRVLEVNGARYHGTVIQRADDASRRRALERDGYVVRELWAGQLHDPAQVRATVEDLLSAPVSRLLR